MLGAHRADKHCHISVKENTIFIICTVKTQDDSLLTNGNVGVIKKSFVLCQVNVPLVLNGTWFPLASQINFIMGHFNVTVCCYNGVKGGPKGYVLADFTTKITHSI